MRGSFRHGLHTEPRSSQARARYLGHCKVSMEHSYAPRPIQGMEQGTAINLTTNHLNNEKLSALQQRILDL
ncbi:hypothetical protein HPB47_014573 [Ixodes persulcatus]|uniref:Uncharacterized protein n=1 Tax=Ixodes persulcatus TaxID=34615 RepID=A0AC60QVM8_IXOPE|nr:hypothetical protein HPB47_014573 [Ixodes persulcatus]